jgi:hypothetical protein
LEGEDVYQVHYKDGESWIIVSFYRLDEKGRPETVEALPTYRAAKSEAEQIRSIRFPPPVRIMRVELMEQFGE